MRGQAAIHVIGLHALIDLAFQPDRETRRGGTKGIKEHEGAERDPARIERETARNGLRPRLPVANGNEHAEEIHEQVADLRAGAVTPADPCAIKDGERGDSEKGNFGSAHAILEAGFMRPGALRPRW